MGVIISSKYFVNALMEKLSSYIYQSCHVCQTWNGGTISPLEYVIAFKRKSYKYKNKQYINNT